MWTLRKLYTSLFEDMEILGNPIGKDIDPSSWERPNENVCMCAFMYVWGTYPVSYCVATEVSKSIWEGSLLIPPSFQQYIGEQKL